MSNLKFVDMPTADLQAALNPRNPRSIEESQFKALQRSLQVFDCVEPVVFNLRTSRVVGGHQRVKAAIAQCIASLPVVLIDVSPDKEKAFNLALNKVKGEWDYEKLAVIFQEINPDDIPLTGFSEDEVEELLRRRSSKRRRRFRRITRRQWGIF